MRRFVIDTLENFMIPSIKDVWTQQRIFETIGSEAECLRGEAERKNAASSYGK